MSKTIFSSTKIGTPTLTVVVACVVLFGLTSRASASGFGVSLNLEGTTLTFGMDDGKTTTPDVIVSEPAYVPPPVVVAPKPTPRPRPFHKVVSTPYPPPKKGLAPPPSRRPPIFRGQAPERFREPPMKYSPLDSTRARR